MSRTLRPVHIEAQDLIEVLSERGFRITRARQAVCVVVAASHDRHLTAADIYRLARAQAGTRVDRSTVYRTLDALQETGVLVHSHLGHGPSVYHLADDAGHQHLVCRICGDTLTLPEDETTRFAEAITRATGFHPDLSHFALSGLCARCAGEHHGGSEH
jgi:Fur family transcriptional regulator, ferric uptake regulator